MSRVLRSVLTAGALGVGLVLLVRETVAPQLPPYVGVPDAVSERNFSFPPAPRLIIEAGDGAIRVQVGKSNACEVSARAKVYATGEASASMAEEWLPRLVEIALDDDEIRVRSLPEAWPEALAAQVSYVVTVAPGTDVVITGNNGNVHVGEGCGEVRIDSRNADVEIQGAAGPVEARSINGRIRLVDGRSAAALETVNGNIVADLWAGRLSAHSVNGNVSAAVLSDDVVSFSLTSENGDVQVRVSDDVGVTLDARARRGRVSGDVRLDSGDAGTGSMHGVSGDGAVLLTLATDHGTIRVSRR